MSTLHYREVVCEGCFDVDVIDESRSLDLHNFASVCGQSPDWVLQLLEYEILAARPDHRIHQFFGEDIARARRAYRLQRDFEASLAAVAMMMDLIDEVQQLRHQVRFSEYHTV
ncbi:chaperone modulator CbpM [Acinetobacter larvae]|uniref:MerR family transcriptional regulator n=1 Tax=Acinetobacter larvae TaxID=1789224 RepID=A0A1B2LW52_9GAMM|nr:chaperone modulator CbpM [Acinetobacter larvae]AOA57182.1 MerR family transcriptional regulator [Acinetobacter larvae]